MEVLVVVDDERATAATWTALWPLRRTQEVTDRVFSVECDPQVARTLRGLPGVIGPDEVGAGLAARLTVGERLFVSGWAARGQVKDRPMDGESWGAAPDA